MTPLRLFLAVLAAAGGCTIAAAWRSDIFEAAILISVFCVGAAVVVSRFSHAEFSLFCLGQPMVILSWYSSVLLPLVLEMGLMTAFLHCLGQISLAKQKIAWVAAIPLLALAMGMATMVRHTLSPLVITLAVAAFAAVILYFSAYRISTRFRGGTDEEQAV